MGDPVLELDDETAQRVQEIVGWLRDNYEGISRACEANNLPKPPRWESIPKPPNW
ncbi:MAG TPA: hypothetical protein VG318_10485 [Actinomycetota bacterium]|nr:hypothetical protein [Actinomycetota bacterium]